jgi:hypothetical protein
MSSQVSILPDGAARLNFVMPAPRADLARYAKLIESALAATPPAFDLRTGANDTLQVECGMIFPARLTGASTGTIERSLAPLLTASSRDLNSVAIVDQQGHRRPAYRGLLIYAALHALILTPDAPPHWQVRLRPWLESLATDLAQFTPPADPIAPLPAASGALATAAAWSARALHLAQSVYQHDAWRHLAASTFDEFARRQLPTGQFLFANPSDNPETHWYHELCILHAAASYAVQSGDPVLISAATRNAAFHQAETQPDHATHQPWGLAAFLLDPATHPLADQLLHSASALPGAGGAAVSGITSILLADALYCLRLLLK